MTSNNNSTKIQKSQDQGNKELKVAIVHDFLLYPGGAEKVLGDICELYPDAHIFTLLYDKSVMGEFFDSEKVCTSFLQRWPKVFRKNHKWLLPFFGTAIESFDLRDFDLVISSSGAWSKGIVTRLNTKHVAYVHSPMRYVWDENEYYAKRRMGKKNNFCVRALLSYLRVWDNQAAQRPDVLVANSIYTQKRIEKYYRRDAQVVYPAVELDVESVVKRDKFVIISRLSEYKNVALAIEACNKLQLPLTVIGQGREEKVLKKMAGDTIDMVGWVSEEQKKKYLASARAFIFPSEDDFGITCVEALRAGVPVIGLGKGGAKEIIHSGKNGELFEAPTVEMLADALRRFIEKENQYNRAEIIESANKYSKENFKKGIINAVNKVFENE
ncbi:MAG: glycosyltransferase [Candidatus Moraniibacteriota bacterium]|jgi:glycosyltransferase involved in cell wall biosynthesis